jgi:sterol 14-demethylase
MEQKKFVKVGLSNDNLRAYVGMIEEEVEEYLRTDPAVSVSQSNVNEWGQFDALKFLQGMIILTASRTLQGREVRGSLDKTFAQIYDDLDGGFTPLNFLFPSLPLDSYRKRDVAHKKMSEFYVNIIRQRRDGLTKDVSVPSFKIVCFLIQLPSFLA